jgi:hypothetical protein
MNEEDNAEEMGESWYKLPGPGNSEWSRGPKYVVFIF